MEIFAHMVSPGYWMEKSPFHGNNRKKTHSLGTLMKKECHSLLKNNLVYHSKLYFEIFYSYVIILKVTCSVFKHCQKDSLLGCISCC